MSVIEHTPKDGDRSINADTIRIDVPKLFRLTYGRAPGVVDHARIVIFTNRIADFLNAQAHRWRHKEVTPELASKLSDLVIAQAKLLREQGV